jgi:hypothetical protein
MMLLRSALFVAIFALAAPAMAQDTVQPVPMGIATPAVTGAPPAELTAQGVTPPVAAPAAEVPPVNPNAPVDPNAPPAVAGEGAAAVAAPLAPVPEGAVNPNEMPSLLFTYWEHTAIEDAKRYRGRVRPPEDSELMVPKGRGPVAMPPPEERDIRLGGIVYVNGDDWTIWLNGKRVTPTAVPHEAMDLKVYDQYIEMKWFDSYTNQIFPLRLRPHQRFNIDTRIFLPG